MLDSHRQMGDIHFLAQPIGVESGIVDIVVDFRFDHILTRKPLPPPRSAQDNAMSGAIPDQYAGAPGCIRVVAASKNIPRLFIDDRKPVKRSAAIVKNDERFHAIGYLRLVDIVPNPYHRDLIGLNQ